MSIFEDEIIKRVKLIQNFVKNIDRKIEKSQSYKDPAYDHIPEKQHFASPKITNANQDKI